LEQALQYARVSRERYIRELIEYLAIPSISSDPAHKEDIRRCAEWTAGQLRDIGMENVQLHSTAGHPVVTADWLHAANKPTALIYGHYDVQPVDPLDLWEQDPFTAAVKNERIVARGAADDKGQLFMHFKALEAVLKKSGRLPVNVKFVIEGEEEIGSVNLSAFLRAHKADLKADVSAVSDTSMWAEGIPSITYGLRGLTYLEIELTGPNRDLHSGTYGGAVANPAEVLARMLARVKDNEGRVQIPGFYNRVVDLTEQERKLFRQIPFDEAQYKHDLGVAELWGEGGWTPLEQVWARPTFEVNGIWGGYTGVGAKTVLPAKASAKVSMRLAPKQDPDEIVQLAEKYFMDNAPKSVEVKVIRHHGGKPVIVPLDNPYLASATRALREAWQREPLFIREGGSIPIVADFKEILGLDTLLLGFALPDNRAHSPNENFHLPTFYTGIESLVRFLFYLSGEG